MLSRVLLNGVTFTISISLISQYCFVVVDNFRIITGMNNCLQCFDTVRKGIQSVKKLSDEVLAGLSVCSKVQMICICFS